MTNLNLQKQDINAYFIIKYLAFTTFITLALLLIAVIGYRYNYFTVGYSLLFLTKYAVYCSIFSFSLSLISIGYSLKL